MRSLRPLALIGVPALVLVGALMFWLQGGRYASTENAFVKADIAQIASEVPGRIIEVHVQDHAVVAAGDLLVRLDPEPYRLPPPPPPPPAPRPRRAGARAAGGGRRAQ